MSRRSRALLVASAFACLAMVCSVLRDLPLPSIERAWSIGVYTGSSPFDLRPDPAIRNPVLTASDVTDLSAAFVADPFIVRQGDTWHMLFEAFDRTTRRGVIAWATSDDLTRWRYRRVVLEEAFHLSYPQLFAWNGEYYLVPESSAHFDVRLYRAERFPERWRLVGTLLADKRYEDPTIVRFDDRWWLFVGTGGNSRLELYHADALEGPWRPHPLNPIIAHARQRARPAGRMLTVDGRLIRFAQDDSTTYGERVNAFQIQELTPSTYAESSLSGPAVIGPAGHGWNARGMHHLDAVQIAPGRWMASVDGFSSALMFGVRHVHVWPDRRIN